MSNQEAIALLRNLEDSLDSYCELSEEGKTAFRMAIEALSSSEFPNSSDTDAISRQAAIEVVQNRHMMLSKEKVLLINDLEKLPPVEPKRETATVSVGVSKGGITMWYECDACGEPVDPGDTFCSGCGRELIHE